jgi:hypothetical protein
MNLAGNASDLPDILSAYFFYRAGNDRAMRKIEMVDAGMDRIDLDGRTHVETRLLEAERHATRPRK